MSDEAHSSPWRYVASWIALAALTTLTYTLAKHDFGNASLAVALLIAGAKATIVVLFFMHLWDQKGANRIVFAVSLLFVIVLGGLTIVEMATRFPLAGTTAAAGTDPFTRSETPTTATSATLGWRRISSSTSIGKTE